jgi:EmrB/QacA subfamily drug resistance transporter
VNAPSPSPSTVQPRPTSYDVRTPAQRWTLLVVCLATAMLMLDIAVVNTALSDVREDLGAGSSGLQWLVDAYTLPLAAAVITAGSIADRFGRRRLFLLGTTVFTTASLLCALAPTIVALDLARALQGTGAAVMFSVSLAVLSVAFPRPGERMPALAAYGATMAASFAIGPLVGGALTSAFGWRAIFVLNLPLGALCIALVLRHVRESTDPRAPRVDVPGLVTSTGGLLLLVLALLRGDPDGWGSATVVVSLIGAAVLLALFVVVEARVAQPMLPLGLFGDRRFSAAQVAAVGLSGSLFALWFYLTLYLQQVLGLSPIEAGLVYLPGTLLNFAVAAAMASVGLRVASAHLVGSGLLLVALGLVALTIVAVDSPWWLVLPGLLVALVGAGILNPTIGALALDSAPAEQAGLAAGVNDMFRQAAIAIGIAGLGALVPMDFASGPGLPDAYVDGFHHALWLGAALAAVCGAAAAWLLREPRPPAAGVHDV